MNAPSLPPPNSATDRSGAIETSSPPPSPEGVERVGDPNTSRSSGLTMVFLSTFTTIFLAEIGDKTQLTTLLMTAESHSPASVFVGAGLALVATSALGVWIGRAIAKRVSPQTIDISAGTIFLLVSILLFGDAIQL